jgi:hypothetical protein
MRTASAAARNGRVRLLGPILLALGLPALGGCEDNLRDAGPQQDCGASTSTLTGSLAAPRGGHTATLLQDGKVLVAGGGSGFYNSDEVLSAELYDPATGTFSATGGLFQRPGGYTATLLQSGKVLLAGGSIDRSAELYDPDTGTFSATGSPVVATSFTTATLLGTGRVLVTGGDLPPCSITDGGVFCPPAPPPELYDPAAGTFSVTRCLAIPRANHTATLLPSGQVLVVGGLTPSDGGVSPTASAELYDPE